jgi:hypothetical protein
MGMTEVKYPQVTVKLIGEDGNAFSLIAAVHKALREQIGRDEGIAFLADSQNCESYDALLVFIQQTVNVA